MNKLFSKIAALSVGLAMAVGVGVAVGSKGVKEAKATEMTAYTLDGTVTGGSNGYTTASDITQGSVSWKVVANTTMNPWRFGNGKSASAGTRTVQSQGVVSSENISKIVITTSNVGITPSEVTLKVGTSVGGGEETDTTYAWDSPELVINRPAGKNWTGKYFEIGFTIDATASKYFNLNSIVFKYEAADDPMLSVDPTSLQVGIGSTDTFTVNYYNLTSAFTVTSSQPSKASVTYTGATGTGSATVTVNGLAAATGVSITVASTGAESKVVTVDVVVLPIFDLNLNEFTWNNTSYATSPHTLTRASYETVVSAGQLNSGTAYLGSNSDQKAVSQVSSDSWTLKGSSIAETVGESWLAYGQAVYMSNFGVLHPTSFSLTYTARSGSYNATDPVPTINYFILGSVDGGDSWEQLSTGAVSETAAEIGWSSNSKYVSQATPVQFAFVTTASTYGTLNNVSVKSYGDSLANTKVLDHLYVSGSPKTEYYVGQPFDLQGAKVYANYTDSVTYPDEDVTDSVSWADIAHGDIVATGTYGSKQVEVAITVTDEGSTYSKITSVDQLYAGVRVVLGTAAGNYVAGPQTANNRKPLASGAILEEEVVTGVTNYDVRTAIFTVGVEDGKYTFHDGNGYLYAASSSNNYLRVQDEVDDNSRWTVTIVDGVATITATGSNTHNIIGGNGSAFGAYESTTNYVSLYLVDDSEARTDAREFTDNYMHMNDPAYSGDGTGLCKTAGTYSAAKAAFNLLSSAAKTMFLSDAEFEAAAARLRAWAKANNDEFNASNTIVAGAAMPSQVFENNNSAIVIIVIASALTTTAFGLVLILKKKKHSK